MSIALLLPSIAAVLPILVLLGAGPALGHSERPTLSPIRPGPVPDIDRACENPLVVCKADSKPTLSELFDILGRLVRRETRDEAQAEVRAWLRNRRLFKKCRYEHIQDAVNEASDDTCIQIMPGVYLEEPSRAFPETSSGDLPDGSYSYEYHVANPHDANLVAILGKKNVTLEGTGAFPRDVVVDAGFAKDVVIRADRSDGIIVRNLWARDSHENGIYFIDLDGYIFDRTVGSFAEYQLFAFSSDNGLFTDCEALGGGDSGLYVGQSPDTRSVGRFSAEIRNCKVHHNALGFSGTQGNSVWMHHNDFFDNAIGISYNTQNDHANPPQRASLIENNHIHHNNFDIYAADSDVPVIGAGADFLRFPVGTGMWIVGGEDNVVRNNRIHDNDRFGLLIASNPFEGPVPADVHRNEVVDNLVGEAAGEGAGPNSSAFPPGGFYAPGGSDFWWDESGNDNCWGPNQGDIKTDPVDIPGPCPDANQGGSSAPGSKLALISACLLEPEGDEFVTTDFPYPCPWGHANLAPGNGAELECGNGVLDLGELCDPAADLGESCESLGHGPGALACGEDCTWDTSACEADMCGRVGPATLRVKRVNDGDDDSDDDDDDGDDDRHRSRGRSGSASTSIRIAEIAGDHRHFDPVAEGLEIVLRDDDAAIYAGQIPPGSRRWTVRPDGSLRYHDRRGTHDGIRSVVLGAGIRFGASLEIKRGGFAAPTFTETATVALRIGDDCWPAALACGPPRRGHLARCKRRIKVPDVIVEPGPSDGGDDGGGPYGSEEPGVHISSLRRTSPA